MKFFGVPLYTIARLAILFRATPPIARQASGASFFCDAPCEACLWTALGYFKERSGGVAVILCDTTENTARQVLLHLSRDRGVFRSGHSE